MTVDKTKDERILDPKSSDDKEIVEQLGSLGAHTALNLTVIGICLETRPKELASLKTNNPELYYGLKAKMIDLSEMSDKASAKIKAAFSNVSVVGLPSHHSI